MSDPDTSIHGIFNEALERDHSDRDAFLDAVCQDNAALREKVEALLEAYEKAPECLKVEKDGIQIFTPPDENLQSTDLEQSLGGFGHYVLLEELGRGGQGSVYLARDEDLGRNVALKVLSIPLAVAPDALLRFRREAEAASKVDDPGICTVYEAGEVQGVPYIAMRYVEGSTLAERISDARKRTGGGKARLPVVFEEHDDATTLREEFRRILQLFESIARSLHTAHEAGLIHRDLKPANIMVTASGKPVIVDFGLVRDLGGDEPTLTRTGQTMGTPHYMSPEQISGGSAPVDRTTDVYSLGATLYECLTLSRPFEAATREGLYREILSSDSPDPRRRQTQVSRDLAVVLETALEKSPERRYRTALDLAEDLRRVREHQPIRARPAGPLLRTRRWAQRNPVLATSFVLLSVALILSLFFMNELRERERFLRALLLASAAEEAAEKDPLLGLLLAQEAVGVKEMPETLSSLHGTLSVLHERNEFHLHQKRIRTLAVSGRRFVTGSDDRTARICDLDDGEIAVLDGQEGSVYTVLFSPDGSRILTNCVGGYARLWDRDGNLLRVLGEEENLARGFGGDFSSDGRWILTTTLDGEVRIWDRKEDCKLRQVLHGHEGLTRGKCTDSGHILTASHDGTARIWRFDGEAEWAQGSALLGHEYRVSHLDFSPERGGLILTAAGEGNSNFPNVGAHDDAAARVWTLDGEFVRSLERHEQAILDARFSPDGRTILTVSWDGAAHLSDLDGHRQILHSGDLPLVFGIFSPDGNRVLLGDKLKAQIYDVRTGKQVAVLRGDHDLLTIGAFSETGAEVLTADEGGTVKLWSVSTSPPTFQTRKGIVAAFVEDGEKIVSVSEQGVIQLWDRGGEWLRDYPTEGKSYEWVASSPRGGHIVACGYYDPDDPDDPRDGIARIWKLEEGGIGEPVETIEHEINMSCAVLSPDESLLLTTHYSGRGAYLWDLATRSILHHLPCDKGNFLSFRGAFSRDGDLVVIGSDDRKARVWSVESGKLIVSYKHPDKVWCVGFSPDGDRVVTGSWDGVVWVWDLEGNELFRLEDHQPGLRVMSAEFSPRGDTIATASLDGTLRLWDTSGERISLFTMPEKSGVFCATFSPSADRILTLSLDRVLRLWIVEPTELRSEASRRAFRALTPSERSRYPSLLGDSQGTDAPR